MSTLPLPAAPVPERAAEEVAPVTASARPWVRRALQGPAAWALGDQVVYSFGNMVAAALLSRHCAAVVFGEYILTQRAMDVLIAVSNTFLWRPFTFRLPGTSSPEAAAYQGSVLGLQSVFCLVASLALGLLFLCTGGGSGAHASFGALLLTGAGILFREFTRRMYFAHLRYRTAFWTDVATVGLQTAGLLWLALTGRLTLNLALAVLCGGAVLVSLWWLVAEWRTWRFGVRRAWKDLRDDLPLGRWLFGSNMLYLASAQCNPWVLSALLGGSAVGTYAIAESLVNIPRVALASMENTMGPGIARAYEADGVSGVSREVERLNRMLLLASVAFCGLVWISAPFGAQLIYRRVPPGTRLLALLLGVNLVLYACRLPQSFGLTALRRAQATVHANGLGLLAQVALCALLIHRFEVPGAAVSLAMGSAVALIVREIFYRREMRRAHAHELRTGRVPDSEARSPGASVIAAS